MVVVFSLNAQTEIKDFSLTNVKDGKQVSLSNYKSSTAIAVIFTSHECRQLLQKSPEGIG